MLKVCLLGQPYWVERLRSSLSRYCAGDLRVSTFLPRVSTIPGSLHHALGADILIRIGFRPGAPTSRGRVMDACWSALRALNRNASAVYYWIGSDVLQTIRDFHSGAIRQPAFERARSDTHLAEAEWLATELSGVGIHADVIRFPVAVLRAQAPPPLPGRFTVLTHVPDFRSRFYGGDSIYEAARALPDTAFDVVAGTGSWIPAPLPNLHFHGWQTAMSEWYARASVVVRMVEHDGLGLTIQEALSFGRYAVYNYPVPYTLCIKFGDTAGLISCLGELSRRHQANGLQPNLSGWKYAIQEYNEATDTRTLTRYLNRLSRSNGRNLRYA